MFSKNVNEGLQKYAKRAKQKYNDGGIEITPFNMEDELEEGTIDAQGEYHEYSKRREE